MVASSVSSTTVNDVDMNNLCVSESKRVAWSERCVVSWVCID